MMMAEFPSKQKRGDKRLSSKSGTIVGVTLSKNRAFSEVDSRG